MNKTDPSMTEAYRARPVEMRMTRLIDKYIPKVDTIIDIGCGAGIYGASLGAKANHLIGLDISRDLCETARVTGYYEKIICASIAEVPRHVPRANAIFCSEVLEHLPPHKLKQNLEAMHSITPKVLLFTTPNPISPHYRHDPTHIGRYNIYSMKKALDAHKSYNYSIKALGFADYNLEQHWLCRFLNPLSANIPMLSPTVAYVGHAKDAQG